MRRGVEHEVGDRAAAVTRPFLPPLDGDDVAHALLEPRPHAVVLGDDPLAEVHRNRRYRSVLRPNTWIQIVRAKSTSGPKSELGMTGSFRASSQASPQVRRWRLN